MKTPSCEQQKERDLAGLKIRLRLVLGCGGVQNAQKMDLNQKIWVRHKSESSRDLSINQNI